MNQPDAATQQFEQLMQRPDIEQATGHYDELFNKIREHLARTFPAILWQQTNEPSNSGCGDEFGDINVAGRSDAKERGLGNWRAQGGIPEDRWSEAQALVDNIARDYGFNSGPVVVKDNPSDHYVTFYDPYKAQLTFGSAVNTVLLLRTGCHLTPEAKQRGELSPTRTY